MRVGDHDEIARRLSHRPGRQYFSGTNNFDNLDDIVIV